MAETYTENTVEYGVCNVHYAKATYNSMEKKYTYGEVKPMPGCTSLSFPASGSLDPFYADNIKFFVSETNNGYDGTATFARIPDSFFEDILGETNGVENADTKTAEFALLFEFDGDKSATKHVLYRCKATRPSLESKTKEDSIEPNTPELEIVVMPRLDNNIVKARCEEGDTDYSTWYTKPVTPVTASAASSKAVK